MKLNDQKFSIIDLKLKVGLSIMLLENIDKTNSIIMIQGCK